MLPSKLVAADNEGLVNMPSDDKQSKEINMERVTGIGCIITRVLVLFEIVSWSQNDSTLSIHR